MGLPGIIPDDFEVTYFVLTQKSTFRLLYLGIDHNKPSNDATPPPILFLNI